MRRKRLVPGMAALLVAAARGKGDGAVRGPVTPPAPPSAPTANSVPRRASSGTAGAAGRGTSRADVPREAFPGKVVGVSDGDTVTVLRSASPRTARGSARGSGKVAGSEGVPETVKVRLDGVDCPESRQPFGRRAKELTSSLVFGKEVRIEVRDVDRYSRRVARVVLPDGRDLSEELVRSGLAWWYRKYSKDPALEALEAEAREARRGLWADPAAARTPPWEYRAAAKAR